MVNLLLPLPFEEKIKFASELCRYEATEFSPFDFIYDATAKKGKVKLWKVLITNICRNNCLYCANRWARRCKRFKIEPEKLAATFWELYCKGIVEGLFISSAEYPNPDYVQELLLKTIAILREKYRYQGYIHCKIMPGVSTSLMEDTSRLSSRVSINLEAPGERYLKQIAPDKSFTSLMRNLNALTTIKEKINIPAGITTQLIIGIGEEDDRTILSLAEKLYRKYGLKRVFYSRFKPIEQTPLEERKSCNPLRQLRLYQADFLIRDYGFKAEELVYDEKGNLLLNKDPKYIWAKKNFALFPLEVNTASLQKLIRVPGIGKTSARRILDKRRQERIRTGEQLKELGVDVKTAKQFLLIDGRSLAKQVDFKLRSD